LLPVVGTDCLSGNAPGRALGSSFVGAPRHAETLQRRPSVAYQWR
jgi:hypothetical protein